MHKHTPSSPRKPKFDILQQEYQDRGGRPRPPAFRNNLEFTARELPKPIRRKAEVITWILVKWVTERRDQM